LGRKELLKEIRKSLARLEAPIEPEEIIASKEEAEIEKLLQQELKKDAEKKKKPKVSRAGTKLGNVPNSNFNPAMFDQFGLMGKKR
jgi:hypothetical protein